jgi:hypothetical protein
VWSPDIFVWWNIIPKNLRSNDHLAKTTHLGVFFAKGIIFGVFSIIFKIKIKKKIY